MVLIKKNINLFMEDREGERRRVTEADAITPLGFLISHVSSVKVVKPKLQADGFVRGITIRI
jgi:hypothetical protein